MAQVFVIRRGDAAVRLLRALVVVAVALGLLSELDALPSPTWASALILACAASGAIVALWHVIPGIICTAIVLGAELAFGTHGYFIPPLMVTTITVVAAAPLRTSALTCTGYATTFVMETMRWGYSGVFKLSLLSICIVLGVVLRVLLRRVRRSEARIKELSRSVSDIRREIRRELSDEIAILLTDDLERNQRLLEDLNGQDVPQLRAKLTDVASRSRTSLARLRELMLNLRHSGEEDEAANQSLVTVIEALEDELVNTGHNVELELPPEDGPVPGLLHRTLREVADHARVAAVPGCMVALTVERAHAAIHVHISYPTNDQDAAAPTTLGALTGAIEQAGGKLSLSVQPGHALIDLNLPDVSRSASGRLRPRGAVMWSRFVVRVIAMIGAIAVGSKLLQDLGIGGTQWPAMLVWTLTWLALLVGTWRVSIGVVMLIMLLAYGFTTPFAVAFINPVHMQLTLLGGLICARRPKLAAFVVGASGVYLLAWNRLRTPFLGLGLTLFSLLGVLAGVAVAYFISTWHHQLDEARRLAEEAAGARAQEQRQLAGELHDIIAHQLTQMTMQVMVHAETTDPGELRVALRHVADINRGARSDLVTLITLMRQSRKDGRQARESSISSGDASDGEPPWSVPSATATAVASMLRQSGQQVEVNIDPTVDELETATQRTVIRVLREAATNIIRYARPHSACRLEMRCAAEGVQVIVSSSLETKQRASIDSTGCGLLGLRERVDITGGTFYAGPRNGQWVVRAFLPRGTEAHQPV